jgi:hypothetical protein
MPPLNVLHSKAFIVDADVGKWIYISDARMVKESRLNILVELDNTGNMTGESRLVLVGFAKSESLDEEKKNSDEKDKKENDLSANTQDLIVDTVVSEQDDENSDTLIQRIRFHFTPSNTGNNYFLNPFIFSYFKKNPFSDSLRLNDIDFGCTQAYYMSIHLKTAENFAIEDFPKKVSIRMQDSSILFRREVFQEGHEILIRITFMLNAYYFTKENYRGVKSFFDKVYALINEEILLRKKD